MTMGRRALLGRVILVFLLAMISCGLPSPSSAAWVNSDAAQCQVGGKLAEIPPRVDLTAPGIPSPNQLVNPTCLAGGSSLALVRGSKLAGVDPVLYPVVLVVSCLDSGSARMLNFISPAEVLNTRREFI